VKPHARSRLVGASAHSVAARDVGRDTAECWCERLSLVARGLDAPHAATPQAGTDAAPWRLVNLLCVSLEKWVKPHARSRLVGAAAHSVAARDVGRVRVREALACGTRSGGSARRHAAGWERCRALAARKSTLRVARKVG